MRYFILNPKDQKKDNWIFFEYSAGPLHLRKMFAEFQCPVCCKIDEDKALEKGIAEGIRIKSKENFLLSNDVLIRVNQHFDDVIKQEEIKGLDFVEIPSDKRFKVAIPEEFAEVDPKCHSCGRYSEVYIALLYRRNENSNKSSSDICV